MLKKMKFLTLGVSALLTLGLLAGCADDPEMLALEQALAIPTLAIKPNGQSLEVNEGFREEIDGTVILLRDVVVFGEDDTEYDITISWSYETATADYWTPLKERNEMPGLITDTAIFLAVPRLPAFGTDPVDTAIIATATYGTKTLDKEFPITLLPEKVDVSTVPIIPLNSTTPPVDAPDNGLGGKIVRVRGYLTHAMTDWDSAYIHNGTSGINLYKLSYTPEYIITVDMGDYVEAMGTFALYGGMRQLSYISRLTQVTPDENAVEPTYTTINEANWPSLVSGNDGKLVRLEGLTFDAAATGTISLGTHFTFKLKLGATTINCYLNYHVGIAIRTEVSTMLQSAINGTTITYTGVLGWYSGPQLLPIYVDNVAVVSPS